MSLEQTRNFFQDTRLQTMQIQNQLEKQTEKSCILNHMQKLIMMVTEFLNYAGFALQVLIINFYIILLSMTCLLLYSTDTLNHTPGKDKV